MFERYPDGELVDAMGAASRAESAATARRLLAVGELHARRAKEWSERGLWCTDPFDAVAAEVSAAQNISRARAGGQITYGIELRNRLPQVAAVFATGVIDFPMVRAIIKRTSNVDGDVIAEVDAALARHAPKWMKHSGPKVAHRIDLWIAKFDPDGVRVPPQIDDSRYVEVAPTVPGMAGISANIHASAAAAFDQRLDALAATTCKEDPRTHMQRRSDAVGAMAMGADRLACMCGSPQCPAGTAAAPGAVVIHLLAEQSTVDGSGQNPGYLPKFGIQPAESVRALAKGARLKPLAMPAVGQLGYRPTRALMEFVHWRDLTCRWPGCDAPAESCDVDHTVPYPLGSTHASNLKLYCRHHHLVKTFYCGPGGWSETQKPDGTVILIAPTKHEYATFPGGAMLFPALAIPTGALPVPATEPPVEGREMCMPIRKRTREQNRKSRVSRERQLRADINAEERLRWLEANDEPPPF